MLGHLPHSTNLILGSQSKGRQNILKHMGYTFAVMSADIDEKSIRADNPQSLTLAIANAKADALWLKIHERAILLTADTVVVVNGEIREKPETEEQARAFLGDYGKNPVETVTAVVAVNTATGRRASGIDGTRVWFRPIPNAVIDEVIADGRVFTWAGGFAIQHPAQKEFIERIDGTVDSVIGLPPALTEKLIREVQI